MDLLFQGRTIYVINVVADEKKIVLNKIYFSRLSTPVVLR